MQQQISFQDEVQKLNERPNPQNGAQTGIQIILAEYMKLMKTFEIDCSDLEKIFNGVVNEELIRHLYFDEQFFLSGNHPILEKTIAKILDLQDRHADENKECLGRLYQKFDFTVKYVLLCAQLIQNNTQPPIKDPSPLLINFALNLSPLPLSNYDLINILRKIISNNSTAKRYMDFFNRNDTGFSLHQIIIAEYYLRAPDKEINIVALTNYSVKNTILNQLLNSCKETISERKDVFRSLSQLIDVIIQLQQEIISLQGISNTSWHGLHSNDESGRRKVYLDELGHQANVHGYMQNFSVQFGSFMAKFRSQEQYVYSNTPREILDDINNLESAINKLTEKENKLLNSIENRSRDIQMTKNQFGKHLQKIKDVQQELLTSFQQNSQKLTDLDRSLKVEIDKLTQELQLGEDLQKQNLESTIDMLKHNLETCDPSQKEPLEEHMDKLKQELRTYTLPQTNSQQQTNLPEKPLLENPSELVPEIG